MISFCYLFSVLPSSPSLSLRLSISLSLSLSLTHTHTHTHTLTIPLYLYLWLLVAQSCLTLCDLMDCNPPGSSIHGLL